MWRNPLINSTSVVHCLKATATTTMVFNVCYRLVKIYIDGNIIHAGTSGRPQSHSSPGSIKPLPQLPVEQCCNVEGCCNVERCFNVEECCNVEGCFNVEKCCNVIKTTAIEIYI